MSAVATPTPPIPNTPRAWYAALIERGEFAADPAQERALAQLQQLFEELVEFRNFRQRPFVKTFDLGNPPKGLYLHGGVGRGKSALMDAFFRLLPYRRKQRVHFHAFMRDVHERMSELKSVADPLAQVAIDIARRNRVLCLDEFHVSDIGDAMILARLLEQLCELGVVLVTTSNFAPSELYRDGLQRERFLPAIALLERRLRVIALDAGVDYRLRKLDRMRTYLTPLSAAAEAALAAAFTALSDGREGRAPLPVNGRQIAVKRRAPGAAWFDFAELCVAPRSQLDYLEIARAHHSVLVSGVPRMSKEQAAEARRFTWLVDICYEHRVKLMLSAESAPELLYPEGLRSDEFARTVSRLIEMQSHAYLALAHIG